MVYTPDFSNDLELAVYGLSTFVLKVEGQPDIVLPNAVQDEPTAIGEMQANDGQVIQIDRLLVWQANRSPVQPPLGSVLVDAANTYWTILTIVRRHITETWQAGCRNLAILPSVANQATVLRAVYGKGRAGEAKAVWYGLFSGRTPPTADDVIPARFQPIGEEAMLRFSAEWTKETYRVTLSDKLPMELAGGEFRLVDENGNRYRILRYYDHERIDTLPVAICVRITEGAEYWQQGSRPPVVLPAPVFPVSQ